MMTPHSATAARRTGMHGFTLVELMVSLVIGLLLLLFLSSLYFNSRSSSRLNDDNARIQEDGRYALALIGRNLMQAGFGNMQSGTTTDFPPASDPDLKGLTGCNYGFVTPVAVRPVCAAAPVPAPSDISGPSAFTVSYTTEPYYDATNISGAGTDCSGTQAVNASSTQGGIVINNFYVDTKTSTLYCRGNAGTRAPQPVLSNVDNLLITYDLDTGNQYAPVQSTTDATVAGTADAINGNNKVGWDRVVTVTVCLEMHGTNRVVSGATGQSYYKCNATKPTVASDRFLHTTMTRVFTLRNNATASLLN
ncbi:Type IV fimbrial biogenesis protein PilW [Collimonas arenae]|uniref:Type IV fimbrial biogenesis protein PilW n=1 Tax=Collimonas arenae TaxID=279058 RepID=A0A0A1FEW6_9BURK|nr:PilW family protein [Collimonas arenae]AIY43278.1 Type IV fimbrial biogenesis protein PilW [Collimonas arenae]